MTDVIHGFRMLQRNKDWLIKKFGKIFYESVFTFKELQKILTLKSESELLSMQLQNCMNTASTQCSLLGENWWVEKVGDHPGSIACKPL